MNKLFPFLAIPLLAVSFISFSQNYITVQSQTINSKVVLNFADTFDIVDGKARIRVELGVSIIENICEGYISKTISASSSRVGGSSYSFEPLTKIPILGDLDKRISLNRIQIDSLPEDIPLTIYIDYTNYKNGSEHIQKEVKRNLLNLDTKLVEFGLSYFMEQESISQGDDANGLSISRNTSRLNVDIKKMEITKVGSLMSKCKFNVQFALLDLNYNELGSQVIDIEPNLFTDDDYSRNLVLALQEGICQFISYAKEKGFLNLNTEEPEEFIGLQDITQPARTFTNFVDARQAIVTVVTKNGHGSGCKISKDGIVLTNFHVISESDTIWVVTFEGDSIEAIIVMTDPTLDIALLSTFVEMEDFFKLEESSQSLGEVVYAIGTPIDLKLSHSISKGIVSAQLKMNGIGYIQTDAEINWGNSGGALVNSNGQFIGLVNAKAVGVLIEGIGFAISTKSILERINISYR